MNVRIILTSLVFTTLTIVLECLANETLNKAIVDELKFDYIIIGASANGLVAIRSILESYSRSEVVNILLLDKGTKYINQNSNYSPSNNLNVNTLVSEDGYTIKESELEGGRTSYGTIPFVPENVYTGEYYNSLGVDLNLQKLQESYEYVKSVGDMIQPNIRTSWVAALERSFNETGTFPVEDVSEEVELSDLNHEGKVQKKDEFNFGIEESADEDILLNKNSDDLLTSSHFIPYTFLTYGFRRGYKRRSSSRLTNINSRFMYNKNLYMIYNFNVKKILFLKKENNDEIFAECVEGYKIEDEEKLIKYCVNIKKGKIILSTGAINTPMILQRSGIGSVENIRKSNPNLKKPIIENNNIGKGLKDHPTLSIFGFFKGLNLNQTHMSSSDALFSKRHFGTKCKDKMERDDIINGCESITISEFEGFNIYQPWQSNDTKMSQELGKEIRIINDECLSLIRGVSIHIPKPYSEGEVFWDEVEKKPKIRLGLLEDINDMLIMEAGFRRIIRLFRSSNLSSLLVPNVKSISNINVYERKIWNSKNINPNHFLSFMHSNNTRYSDTKNIELIYEKCNLNMIHERSEVINIRRNFDFGIKDEPKYFSKLFNIKDSDGRSVNRTMSKRLKLDEMRVSNTTRYTNREGWLGNSLKNEDTNFIEPSLWKSLPFLLPKLPLYPDKIREYLKKNIRSGNEFVGTTPLGSVVKTQCFKLNGVSNLYILDEGILNKHTNSNPLGTTMILSRYAIMNIISNKC